MLISLSLLLLILPLLLIVTSLTFEPNDSLRELLEPLPALVDILDPRLLVSGDSLCKIPDPLIQLVDPRLNPNVRIVHGLAKRVHQLLHTGNFLLRRLLSSLNCPTVAPRLDLLYF